MTKHKNEHSGARLETSDGSRCIFCTQYFSYGKYSPQNMPYMIQQDSRERDEIVG